MKLNKLTSAVSVSLLAVALTACGSDDDAPIINNTTTTTPAPTTNTNTGTTTTTPADNSANIKALTDAFKAAGVPADKAAELANANPTIAAGSPEFTALVNTAKAPANTGTNTAVSEVVEKANPFINGVDTKTKATVTANQYSRQSGSNFDRVANPAENGGLGAVGTDDPTTQNPYLSNYVLAVEVVDGKVVAIDSTGEMAKKKDSSNEGEKIGSTDSPYVQNNGLKYTADTRNGADRTVLYATDNATGAAAFTNGTVLSDAILAKAHNPAGAIAAADGHHGKIVTIQEINSKNVDVNTTDVAAALAAARVESGATIAVTGAAVNAGAPNEAKPVTLQGLKSGLVVYTSKSEKVGNAKGAEQGYRNPAYGMEENIYAVNANGETYAINAAEKAQAPSAAGKFDANKDLKVIAKETVQYWAENDGTANVGDKGKFYFKETFARQGGQSVGKAGTTSDAVTGEHVDDMDATHLANTVANNLETRVFGKNYKGLEAGAAGNQASDNTYVARYDSKGSLNNVEVAKLQHVQYGRLTTNIDVLANKTADDAKIIAYRQFQQHGADNSVDTYFYRGTNRTTLEQMEAVKAKGGTIQYFGHALTYGIGPKVPAKDVSTGLPTAYGLSSSESTIGNFVQAKFDVAKARVDGSIYNFLNDKVNANKTNAAFVKQDLVSFGGDVYGNTVTGTATKIGTTETGTFTGSFFGKDANELGGSITSISRDVGYSTPAWGAAFGATKGTENGNFNVIEQGGN